MPALTPWTLTAEAACAREKTMFWLGILARPVANCAASSMLCNQRNAAGEAIRMPDEATLQDGQTKYNHCVRDGIPCP